MILNRVYENNKCDESPIERADSYATSVPNRQLKLSLAQLCRSINAKCSKILKMKESKRKPRLSSCITIYPMPDSHDLIFSFQLTIH